MIRKSYRISKPGSIKKLKLVSEELPLPQDHEVTIEIKSIGLNFADVFTVLGLYKAAPKRDFIPGIEFSGLVINKGDLVRESEIGDRVMGVIKFGSFTTHLNIDQRYILKIPNDWTFDEGASFIVNSLTAYYALTKLGNLQFGQTVLIESAVGGVGLYANRIAKRFNAYTIGVIGNESKTDFAKSEGYDQIIVRDKYFKKNLIRALKDRTLDLALESIGGDVLKIKYDLLAPMGRMMIYGGASFSTGKFSSNYFKLAANYLRRPKIDTLRIIEQNKTVSGFNLIWLYDKVEMLKEILAEVQELNLPKPFIGERFPYDKLPDAVSKLKSGKTIGKIVVQVNRDNSYYEKRL